jgi:hypothetical protein
MVQSNNNFERTAGTAMKIFQVNIWGLVEKLFKKNCLSFRGCLAILILLQTKLRLCCNQQYDYRKNFSSHIEKTNLVQKKM